jgi:ABC-type multidrug transport system ATPase subunit
MELNHRILGIINVSKKLDSVLILNDITLNIDQGNVFCLLGPNGGGKTTLINCILALLKPDHGEISIFGNQNLIDCKKRMGIVLEEDGFLGDLSVEKNLRIICCLKNTSSQEIPLLLEKFSLLEHRKKMVKKLSQGMRKRLAIASSLVGNPEFLIWDEPYNGLDPGGFKLIRNLIQDLNYQGKTILISTHLLEEVKKTATNVGLIHNGKLKEILDLKQIIEKYGTLEQFYLHYVPELN